MGRNAETKNMSLKDINAGTPQEFNAIIEIPKGSPDKIEYDEETDEMKVDFVFQNDFKFIYNYGFVPQTLAGDGDTLDVIVLSDKVIPSGSVVKARTLGIVKMLDRGEPDNKIIAVPVDDPDQTLDLEELKNFYAEVARQKKKIVEVLGYEDKNVAMDEIRKSMI